MKAHLTTIFIVLTLSCTPSGSKKENTKPKEVLKDFNTWYAYTYHNIHLSQDFIGLDVAGKSIGKAEFLKHLSTGNMVVLKILDSPTLTYQLIENSSKDPNIKATMKQVVSNETAHFAMEGKQLPHFDFTDVNHVKYNVQTTKGKVLVLKCWFIQCGACIKEFPQVNQLVEEYKDNDEVKFISLASDPAKDLITFLAKKELKYAVIPSAEAYMTDSLGVYEYPTHILVNKKGRIVKVTNTIEDLIPFLKREVGK
jgi:thiol-disulfide isomerase/thioredoxin